MELSSDIFKRPHWFWSLIFHFLFSSSLLRILLDLLTGFSFPLRVHSLPGSVSFSQSSWFTSITFSDSWSWVHFLANCKLFGFLVLFSSQKILILWLPSLTWPGVSGCLHYFSNKSFTTLWCSICNRRIPQQVTSFLWLQKIFAWSYLALSQWAVRSVAYLTQGIFQISVRMKRQIDSSEIAMPCWDLDNF